MERSTELIEPEFDRASGIGGSDVAAILGISPWRSPFDVYLEKTHDPGWSPVLETRRMRLGKLIEPVLREAYMQDHPGHIVREHWSGGPFAKPVWHAGGICYAHLDGTVLIPGPDEDGIWEGKSAGSARDWALGVPEYYEAQVRAYLAITQEPWCDLTVLFLNDARFEHYRIAADPDIDGGLIEVARRFWHEHVEPRIPPPLDGSDAASRYLAGLNPNRILEPPLKATPDLDELGRRLALVRHNQDQAAAARAELEVQIKAAMGEHARVNGTGWSVLWKPAKGATKIGWEQIAKAYRALLEDARQWLPDSDPDLRPDLFTDEALDAILSLYTTTGQATDPFRFTTDEREAPK